MTRPPCSSRGSMTKRPPVVVALSVSAQHVFTASEVELAWEVRGHERLVLETPWGEVLAVDPTDPPRLRLVPARSGAYVLRAINQFGESSASTAPVFVYTPPQVNIVDVPDLARVGEVFQRIDPETVRDVLSLPGESDELWHEVRAAMPTAKLPLESLVTPLPPGFLPSMVDLRELTTVINESFSAGTKAVRKKTWWQRFRQH